MRKLFQFSIAALFGLSLVLAAASTYAASHEENKGPSWTMGGYAEAAWGQHTPGTDSSQFITSWDSQMKFAAKKGPLSFGWNLRNLRDTGLNYFQVAWKPMPALTISMGDMTVGATVPMGHRNGLSGVAAHQGTSAGTGAGPGMHGVLTSGKKKFGAAFAAGPVKLGLEMVGDCVPGCGAGAGAESTTVIWATGGFGPVTFKFANLTGAGNSLADGTGTGLASSGMLIGVKATVAGIKIMFDQVTTTQEADEAISSMSIALEAFNVFFQNVTVTDADASLAESGASMRLHYYISVGKGATIFPIYSTYTPEGGDATTSMLLGMKFGF